MKIFDRIIYVIVVGILSGCAAQGQQQNSSPLPSMESGEFVCQQKIRTISGKTCELGDIFDLIQHKCPNKFWIEEGTKYNSIIAYKILYVDIYKKALNSCNPFIESVSARSGVSQRFVNSMIQASSDEYKKFIITNSFFPELVQSFYTAEIRVTRSNCRSILMVFEKLIKNHKSGDLDVPADLSEVAKKYISCMEDSQ